MQSNGLDIQTVSLKSFEVEMINIYHGVIRKSLVATDPTSIDKKTLSKLRNKYTKKLRKDNSSTISFDSPDVRCAYLFQFCPSFTLAVASQFLAFLKDLPSEQVQKLALRETMTVCCLGGGPATEVVAICAVLGEVRKRWVHQNGKPLLVDVTVVDSEDGWSATAEDVVTSLPPVVDQSLVKIGHFRFVRADLTEDFSKDVVEVLDRSDLVTMTKVLSAIHGPRDAAARTKILQDTTSCMAADSYLFILDSSGWNPVDAMATTVDSFACMQFVYGPRKKTSWLSKPARKLSRESELYGNQCCTSKSTNKTSVWCKRSLTDCNGVTSEADES